MNLIGVLVKSLSMRNRGLPAACGRMRWCVLALLCPLAVAPVWGDALSEPGSYAVAHGEQRLAPVPLPDLSRTEEAVRKRLNQARAVLLEAVESPEITDAELARAYGDAGIVYLSHQLYVAAEACLQNARALAPDDYRWPYYLGYRYQQQDSNLEKAAENYQRALGLRDDYAPTRLRLAQVYLDLDQAARAKPLLLAAMEQEGLRAAALFELGRVAVAERDFQAAVGYFEQSLAANPEAIVTASDRPAAEALANWSNWQQLRAVRDANLVVIPPDDISRPTPRLLNGARRLCAQLDRIRRGDDVRP